MNRNYAGEHFETTPVEVDITEGRSTVELYRKRKDEVKMVAKITFWDAVGQFFLETFHGEIPLVIVEDLIKEAKEKI